VSHELEDVVVIGRGRKLRNFSDLVPESLRKAEGDLTYILKPGEQTLVIDYYPENKIKPLVETFVRDGGSNLKS
jgi:hypothetical protein